MPTVSCYNVFLSHMIKKRKLTMKEAASLWKTLSMQEKAFYIYAAEQISLNNSTVEDAINTWTDFSDHQKVPYITKATLGLCT